MKKQRSKSGSLHYPLSQPLDQRLQWLMEWSLIALLVGTTIIIIPDVSDSVFLKQYVLYAGTLLLLGLGIFRISLQKVINFKLTLVHILVLGYAVCLIISVFYAHNFYLVQQALLFHGCLFILFFVSSELISSEVAEKKVIRWIVNLAWVVGGIALLQAFGIMSTIITSLASGRDVISTLGNANYFGGFLVILIPIVLARLLAEKKTSSKIEFVTLLGVLLFVLLKTETRSSWIAGIVGILIVLFLAIENKKIKWGGIGIVIVGVIVIAFMFPETVMKRLTGMFEMDAHSSFTRRLYFYEGAWKAFLASPVIGNGLGNFILFLPKFRSPDYWIYQSEDIVPHAHNEFLEIGSESGGIAILVYLSIFVALIIFLIKKIRSADSSEKYLLAGYVAAIIGVLADNVISMNLRTVPVAVLFWVIIGMTQRYQTSFVVSKQIHIPSFMKYARWGVIVFIALGFTWTVFRSYEVYISEKNVLRGNIFAWNNEEVHSSEKYIEAISANPSNTFIEYYLAGSYYKQERYAEALQHITTVLKAYPYTPKAHLIAAISSLELNDIEGAIGHIQQELAIASSPQAYYYYAYIVGKNRQDTLERRLLFSMLKENIKGKSPELVDIGVDRLRVLCKDSNSKNDYLSVLKQLATVFETEPKIRISLAKNYYLMGFQKEAQSAIANAESIPNVDAATLAQIKQIREYFDKNIPPSVGE